MLLRPLRALVTLTLAYRNAISLTEDRVHDVEVCDSLVRSGHAVRFASDDGTGYALSERMAAAHRQLVEQRADEAGMN
jgi:hypothetical protein